MCCDWYSGLSSTASLYNRHDWSLVALSCVRVQVARVLSGLRWSWITAAAALHHGAPVPMAVSADAMLTSVPC